MTMATGLNSEKYYRGAVALSNIGCTLLEKGCYGQALEVLQESVLVLKPACGLSSLSKALSVGTTSRKAQDLDVILERAGRYLSSSSSTVSPKVNGCPNNHITVIPIADDADTVQDIEVALRVCPYKEEVVFPIRFESFDSSATCTRSEVEMSLACTIVLHNFGIACLCRSKTVALGTNASMRLSQNAFKIFQLCQTILSVRSSSCSNQQLLKRLFFLGYVVMSTLVLSLRCSGKQAAAQGYRAKLTKLKAGVIELARSEFLTVNKTSAAAA